MARKYALCESICPTSLRSESRTNSTQRASFPMIVYALTRSTSSGLQASPAYRFLQIVNSSRFHASASRAALVADSSPSMTCWARCGWSRFKRASRPGAFMFGQWLPLSSPSLCWFVPCLWLAGISSSHSFLACSATLVSTDSSRPRTRRNTNTSVPDKRRRVVMLEGEIFQRSQTVFRVFHVFPLVRACSLVCSIVFHRVPFPLIIPITTIIFFYGT